MNTRQSWEGFLPKKSVVMGKKTKTEKKSKARLMFIADAPVERDDQAGQLLTKMIEAMGLRREDVIIVSSTQNLKSLLESTRPEAIVALGESSAKELLNSEEPISKIRGHYQKLTVGNFTTENFLPTFHPSHLLKNPASKKEVWGDLQKVAKTLGIKIPKPSAKKD